MTGAREAYSETRCVCVCVCVRVRAGESMSEDVSCRVNLAAG